MLEDSFSAPNFKSCFRTTATKMALSRWFSHKEPVCQCRTLRSLRFFGLGTSPGEGSDNPLQYFCLGNSTDRRAWWATVNGGPKGQTPTQPRWCYIGEEIDIYIKERGECRNISMSGNAEIYPCQFNKKIFEKSAKAFKWERISFPQLVLGDFDAHMNKNVNLDTNLHLKKKLSNQNGAEN